MTEDSTYQGELLPEPEPDGRPIYVARVTRESHDSRCSSLFSVELTGPHGFRDSFSSATPEKDACSRIAAHWGSTPFAVWLTGSPYRGSGRKILDGHDLLKPRKRVKRHLIHAT